MSKQLAEGDRVRVNDREQVAADIKSQLFYNHYRGLVGTVAKVYVDGTVSINVEPQVLTKEVSKRHDDIGSGIRQRWLDSMSEDGRSKLSAAEKQFNLRYTILVAAADVEEFSGTVVPFVRPVAAVEAPPVVAAVEAPRKTLEELEAEEARHLEEIRKQQAG